MPDDTSLHAGHESFSHIHHRIAERVTRELGTDVTDADVYEILNSKTIGWEDGVVEAVQNEAREYGIL